MNVQIKNKNILVTGGAGFVGSNLAKELHGKNKVYVIDNYFTGNESNHIKGVKYFKAETIDVLKIFKNIKLDYIFHLGEYSRVEQSFDDIKKVIDYNIRPLYEIIKLVEKNKAKLIYSGSSTKFSIYFPGDIQSPYAWSKKNNTDFINHYSKWKKINYAIAYFYNVYGPNEIQKGKYATIIGKFLYLKKIGKKSLPITLPGTQKRNFTHIDDIVSGLLLVALKGNGDNYCIGSDESFSIIQVAKMLKMKISYTKAKKGNRKESKINKVKLKKLGWVAKNKLKNYLLQSI
jgi:UDP-glucose 4-epimerase